MRYAMPHRRLSRIVLALVLLSLTSLLPLASQAATPAQTVVFEPAPAAGCPTAPAALPDVIDRATFCVYYNDSTITAAQATTAADHVQSYWDRYVTTFGFRTPSIVAPATKLEVQLTSAAGCNGGTSYTTNVFDAYTGCFSVAENIQVVIGHELFHRVQYSYDGPEVKWFKEGTARAIQDNAFAAIDNMPGALGQGFSFNSEANNYLANTNNDITSIPMRYMSALWWKYFSEQYGSIATEPQRGVDAFLELWEAAETADDIAALNNALNTLGAGVNFNTAFRRFVVANYAKDLSSLPNGSYNYIDEEQAGNPAVYGPLVPTSGGTINSGTPATFNNQSVTRYGARYYSATPGASCPVITASFHRDSGSDAFYHVVTQKGTVFARHVEGSGADWSQSFLNDGITRVTAIIGGQANAAQVDVTLSCANPLLDIKMPTNGAKAFVGPAATPGKLLAQVLVTNGSPTSPVVAGLTINDFKARVNGIEALVTAGGFIQEQYWLVIDAPAQAANGVYDLQVTLEAPGTTTPIATDTNATSVSYSANNRDQVLVIDRSGSMSANSKMFAARAAASFYVDITRNGDGVAVVPFDHNINPAPFVMQPGTLVVRNNAKNYIIGLTPGGATSIGDGLQGAVTQRAASPTGNPDCSFVLLSDGMENSAVFWNDVKAAVQATGCPVTTIAFGPSTDELLLQEIATETGGAYFYNDVFVSQNVGIAANSFSDSALELGNTYEYAQARSENRQRLGAQEGVLAAGATREHSFTLESGLAEVLFALDWPGGSGVQMEVYDPSGTLLDTTGLEPFFDSRNGHAGVRVPNPAAGTWRVKVIYNPGGEFPSDLAYQVLASAPSDTSIELLLPDRLGGDYATGARVPIFAFVSGNAPITDLAVDAFVTAPDGTETRVRLYDDGQHDDGAADDGLYGGSFTRTNQAIVALPGDEGTNEPPAKDEGSYRVQVRARGAQLQREALGAFALPESPDTNTNGLPDAFEQEYGVGAPDADPDLDSLDNLSEYLSGTDPTDSDSDDGGENDGSEASLHGQDPLNPDDDQIEAPEFLNVVAGNGTVQVGYDVQTEYTRLLLYRATSLDGPWTLRQSELPLTGDYTDAASNGQTVFYRLIAIDDANHRSAVLTSAPVKPLADPLLPEAAVIIEDGAPSTKDLAVTLDFAAYDNEDGDTFGDIKDVMLSNDPTFAGAQYQPFAQDIPWQLAPVAPGQVARVYARFRDVNGNESVGPAVGSIKYAPVGVGNTLYLPIVRK